MNFLKMTLFALGLLAESNHCFAEDKESAEKIKKLNATITERFAKADGDKDGTITLEEAKKGMPRVAEDFTAIDTAGSGKVTAEQIKTYMAAKYAGN